MFLGESCVAAKSASDVVQLAETANSMEHLDALISECRACPRLVAWRETVAIEKRAAYREEEYWGRPAPGFGDPAAAIAVVGLAPAAHGANRTGRVFTGDRSGDWLYEAMYGAGLANQPTSVRRDDGLALTRARVLAAVRCAPPANKPTPVERDTCAPWLDRELTLLAPTLRVVVALGAFAWQAVFPALARTGFGAPTNKVRFGHGAEARCGELTVIASYHPSQQNTFTGVLTEPMFDAVFTRANELAASGHREGLRG